ncbi:hypothetical protein BJX96DRAFT_171863 [Aspergillus floccosus]
MTLILLCFFSSDPALLNTPWDYHLPIKYSIPPSTYIQYTMKLSNVLLTWMTLLPALGAWKIETPSEIFEGSNEESVACRQWNVAKGSAITVTGLKAGVEDEDCYIQTYDDADCSGAILNDIQDDVQEEVPEDSGSFDVVCGAGSGESS